MKMQTALLLCWLAGAVTLKTQGEDKASLVRHSRSCPMCCPQCPCCLDPTMNCHCHHRRDDNPPTQVYPDPLLQPAAEEYSLPQEPLTEPAVDTEPLVFAEPAPAVYSEPQNLGKDSNSTASISAILVPFLDIIENLILISISK